MRMTLGGWEELDSIQLMLIITWLSHPRSLLHRKDLDLMIDSNQSPILFAGSLPLLIVTM
jgi:hypothetical protein